MTYPSLKKINTRLVEENLSLREEIAQAEAELAAMKARRCETCEHEIEGVARACEVGVSVWPEDPMEDFDEPPPDFSCNRWTERGDS